MPRPANKADANKDVVKIFDFMRFSCFGTMGQQALWKLWLATGSLCLSKAVLDPVKPWWAGCVKQASTPHVGVCIYAPLPRRRIVKQRHAAHGRL
jgi:hypothetical protein